VKYPKLYADESMEGANMFNCIQVCFGRLDKPARPSSSLLLSPDFPFRACREAIRTASRICPFFSLLMAAGVRYPVAASAAGAVYLLGRIAYFNGYSTGDPKGRMKGSFSYFGMFGLLGMVLRWSSTLLMSA